MFFGRKNDEKPDMDAVKAFLNQFSHAALVDDWSSCPGLVSQSKAGEITVTFPFAAAPVCEALAQWLDAQKSEGENLPAIQVRQRVVPLKAEKSRRLRA